VTLLG